MRALKEGKIIYYLSIVFSAMLKKYSSYIWIWLLLCLLPGLSNAEEDNTLGQTIQIYTQLHSFTGKPAWLLVIRDLDHNQNLPYLYDFSRGNNYWIALTYGRNYLITVSNLQFSPYRANPYRQKKIEDFCQLESNGRIIRGESMYIMIRGDLSPNTATFTCHVAKYTDSNFTIANPDS